MSTYIPIASRTLTGTVSSVTFSGIPQYYTDLVFVVAARADQGGYTDCSLQFNSDSGTNYSYTLIGSTGAAVSSGRGSNTTSI